MKKALLLLLSVIFIGVGCAQNDSSSSSKEKNSPNDHASNNDEKKNKPEEKKTKLSGKIFFMRDNFIYSANPDGSKVSQISSTGEEGKPDSSPSVSRDGKYIVYMKDMTDVYMISSTGGEAKKVANDWLVDYPVLSPDNTKVAYQMDYMGTYTIGVRNTDSGEWVKDYGLYMSPRGWPDWSPDGSTIAGTQLAGDGSKFNLILIDVESAEYEDLSKSDTGHSYFYASFSPDGQKLAVLRSDIGTQSYQLYLMNIDGTGGTELVQNVGPSRPAWSPEGSQIAFEMNDSIYLIPSTGGTPELILENAKSPAWGK